MTLLALMCVHMGMCVLLMALGSIATLRGEGQAD